MRAYSGEPSNLRRRKCIGGQSSRVPSTRAKPKWVMPYSPKVRTFVLPAPTSVALSWSMASTRDRPAFADKQRLAVDKTEGRAGVENDGWSRNGAGLGGGGAAIAAGFGHAAFLHRARGGLAGMVDAVAGERVATTVSASG